MRKQSLRQTANRYLKTDNRGSYKDKKHRAFIIHKMIDDLFVIGEVPSSWHTLKKSHLEKLILLWKRKKIKSLTIMDYMTTIRRFLAAIIGCEIEAIDNKNLGLCREKKIKKSKSINPNFWLTISEPITRLIMGLQIEFGLTFSEAIHLFPDVHIQAAQLWITREISFNSEDRIIHFRNDKQRTLITELIEQTANKNLVRYYGYEFIRHQWRNTLKSLNLSPQKTYRFLYAQQLKLKMLPLLGNYQTDWLIRDEMGIKSRNTLWTYLHD